MILFSCLFFFFWPNVMCLRVIFLYVHLLDPKELGWSSIANVIKMHHQKIFVVIILHCTERCFVELDFHCALNIISYLISFTFMRALSPRPFPHFEMGIFLRREMVINHGLIRITVSFLNTLGPGLDIVNKTPLHFHSFMYIYKNSPISRHCLN